jgi:hypothetical protein
LEDLANGPLPQFGYQIHLASGDVEKTVKDEQSIRQFLKALYGARGPNGEVGFDPIKGILVENLPLIGESRILNGKVSALNQHRNKCFDGIPIREWRDAQIALVSLDLDAPIPKTSGDTG